MPRVQRQQEYKVVIEEDDDGFLVATVPALPGCHTQAKTLKQLQHRIREAIELCLEVSKESPAYRKQIRAFAYEPMSVGVETFIL